LPIQKTKAIIPRNTQRCASGEIKKGALLYVKPLRHSSLDESGPELFRGCRPRRNRWVRKPRRNGIASSSSALPAESTVASASEGGDDIWVETGAGSKAGALASAAAFSSCSGS